MQECCHNDNSATNSVDILINQVALQLWLNILLYCLTICFNDSNSMSSWVFRKCLGYFGVLGIVLKMYTQFLIIYLVLVNIIKYRKLHEKYKKYMKCHIESNESSHQKIRAQQQKKEKQLQNSTTSFVQTTLIFRLNNNTVRVNYCSSFEVF